MLVQTQICHTDKVLGKKMIEQENKNASFETKRNVTLKIRHVPKGTRNLSGEVIDIEIQIGQLGQRGDLGGNVSAERVEVQVETGQALEPCNGAGYLTGQTLALERYVDHASEAVAGHAFESSGAGIGVRSPRAQDSTLRVQRGLQRH